MPSLISMVYASQVTIAFIQGCSYSADNGIECPVHTVAVFCLLYCYTQGRISLVPRPKQSQRGLLPVSHTAKGGSGDLSSGNRSVEC